MGGGAHRKLPQGAKTAVDFRQPEIVTLNEVLDHEKVFLDDAEILGKGKFAQHIKELDEFLTRMEDSGLQTNIKKKMGSKRSQLSRARSQRQWTYSRPKENARVVSNEGTKKQTPSSKFSWGSNFYRKYGNAALTL